jgi:hypothetical protein
MSDDKENNPEDDNLADIARDRVTDAALDQFIEESDGHPRHGQETADRIKEIKEEIVKNS